MKKSTAVLLVSLMAVSGISMAKEGGSGGSMRMEPFSGDINKATPREKQSIYYQIAVVKDKQEKEKLAKAAAEQPVQK